jgi:tRNA-2-methylthio-N6-dimethylallyladenosine synthase
METSVESKLNNYFIWNIGCQMNKADANRLESGLHHIGLENTENVDNADIIVLNSCVVRQSAEDKVHGMLTSLRHIKDTNPTKIIALMGCLVGPDSEKLQKRYPHVDVFMRPQQFKPLFDLINTLEEIDIDGCLSTLSPVNPSVTAFVPIIHGCDKFCSFCIIPYRRGREISRPIEDIVREVELLSIRNVKEVTLLGQNVDSYGHDFLDKKDLADLLYAVNEIKGIERIRFLTSHPNDMSDKIIDAVNSIDKVCEHINLPFQAGDDEVLTIMRRGYNIDSYLKLIEKIRTRVTNVSMGTDLIVGFPGESEKAFQNSLKVLKDVRFDKVHSARYSTREGTIASRKLIDNVPLEEKKDRLAQVDSLQKDIVTLINSKLLNSTQEILVEKFENDQWQGRNRNDKLVFFEREDSIDLIGKTVKLEIDKTSPWYLHGIEKLNA